MYERLVTCVAQFDYDSAVGVRAVGVGAFDQPVVFRRPVDCISIVEQDRRSGSLATGAMPPSASRCVGIAECDLYFACVLK